MFELPKISATIQSIILGALSVTKKYIVVWIPARGIHSIIRRKRYFFFEYNFLRNKLLTYLMSNLFFKNHLVGMRAQNSIFQIYWQMEYRIKVLENNAIIV